MANLSNYINGEWLAGSGAELATIDPSTGRQTWTSNSSTPDDIARAAQAAHDSFEAWALTPLAERIAIATRFRDLLKDNAESLAATIAEEVGKPLWEARTEVATMANKIDISVQALCRAHRRERSQGRRRQRRAAPPSARRVRRLRTVQLPRPPAERPHRAGADRREHAACSSPANTHRARRSRRCSCGSRPACPRAC